MPRFTTKIIFYNNFDRYGTQKKNKNQGLTKADEINYLYIRIVIIIRIMI